MFNKFSFAVNWATDAISRGLYSRKHSSRDSVFGVAEVRGTGFAWPVSTSGGYFWLVPAKYLLPSDRPALEIELTVVIQMLANLYDMPAAREIRAVIRGEEILPIVWSLQGGTGAKTNTAERWSRQEFQNALQEGLKEKTLFLLYRDYGYAKNSPIEDEETQKSTTPPGKRTGEKTWVEFVVVDMEGNPVGDHPYRVTLPDGSVNEGVLDKSGKVRFNGIDPGTCQFSLTDLDRDAWQQIK